MYNIDEIIYYNINYIRQKSKEFLYYMLRPSGIRIKCKSKSFALHESLWKGEVYWEESTGRPSADRDSAAILGLSDWWAGKSDNKNYEGVVVDIFCVFNVINIAFWSERHKNRWLFAVWQTTQVISAFNVKTRNPKSGACGVLNPIQFRTVYRSISEPWSVATLQTSTLCSCRGCFNL